MHRLLPVASLFCLPLFTVALGCSAGGGSSDLENPFAGDPNAIASGEATYDEQCRVCHGDLDRGGSGAPALDPRVSFSTDAEILSVIENGTSGMPGFSEVLTRDESWEIVAYLRDEIPEAQ